MAMASELTLKQLQEFYNIDRKAYSRLVLGLGFDSLLSMKIVSFWNFLERIGFKNFVKNLQELPDALLLSLAKEALMCLDCLYCSNEKSFPGMDMDLQEMKKLAGQDILEFLLGFLFKNQKSAKRIIEDFVKKVCQIAFTDIIPNNLGSKQSPKSNDESECQTSTGDENMEFLKEQKMETMTEDNGREDKENRTLFMTFSKSGHPMTKKDLHGFIVRKFDKCVETIYMDHNPNPLFACVVLRSLSDMSRILGDKDMVKFVIHGKQVRAKRSDPKTVKKQSQCTATTETGFPIKAA